MSYKNLGGYYVVREGTLGGVSGADRKGILEVQGGFKYICCRDCGRVNKFDQRFGGPLLFDSKDIYKTIGICVTCVNCRSHFFVALRETPDKLPEAEKKLIQIVRRGLGKSLGFGNFHSEFIERIGSFTAIHDESGRYANVHKCMTDSYRVVCGIKSALVNSDTIEKAIRKAVQMLKRNL